MKNHKLLLNRSESGGKWSCSHFKTISFKDSALRKMGESRLARGSCTLAGSNPRDHTMAAREHFLGYFSHGRDCSDADICCPGGCLCHKGHGQNLRRSWINYSAVTHYNVKASALQNSALQSGILPVHNALMPTLTQGYFGNLRVPPSLCRSALEKQLLRYSHPAGNKDKGRSLYLSMGWKKRKKQTQNNVSMFW